MVLAEQHEMDGEQKEASILSNELEQLYQLVLTPGTVMVSGWWDVLELKEWEGPYKNGTTRALQKAINRLIVGQRYSSFSLPDTLTATQSRLLRMGKNIRKCIAALGLYSLGVPDYLLVRSYRDAIAELLPLDALKQIWALWRGDYRPPTCEPEALLEHIEYSGQRVINSILAGDSVWEALKLLLPPDTQPCAGPTISENPLLALFRLERFL